MKNLPLLIGTIVGTLILVIGVAFFFSGSTTETTVDQALLTDGATHIRGAENAKVTIVEFSDLQCPACKAASPLVKQVLAQNPEQVRLVYRHFPLLSIHPYAQLAAQASEVAAEEGKFWEMHDKLFETQQEWSGLGSQDEVLATFETYAEELGIDKARFRERIQSEEVKQAVSKDISLAESLNVNSTPTFYVNGYKVPAPQQLPSVVAKYIQE
ncbi:MAG TPA: thioredoxin domain-containing protein [Patescibacteria group bacterium]